MDMCDIPQDDPTPTNLNSHLIDFIWNLGLLFEQVEFISGSKWEYMWLVEEFLPQMLDHLAEYECHVRQDELRQNGINSTPIQNWSREL